MEPETKDEEEERKQWEQKTIAWYAMRLAGLTRLSKPYPNAPEMHYPLTILSNG